jgi:predicted metalloprotease with PDZ domain
MSMATISRSSTLPNRGHFTGGNITEQIHTVLTERECSIFDKGLSLYHKRRDVTGFVEALSLVLNTNSKRQLLVPIRNEFVKPSDLIKFNELAIKYGIALPTRGAKKAAQKRPNKTESGPKLIEVRRDLKGEWGFSIRGGVDHGIGIFISWVDQGSSAERAGLKIGDYIHRVDNMNLEGLTFTQATQV